ncbi:hypothetical protein [uncultured Agrobacterium sp.]|uniref:hypothetical protein n=1 Tax=uncultured Agrobacterium sp. TaxID=157277 RepID=UPI00258C5EDE|nr:hypothetical protein [uncultured Agrobacterium sp.]
MLTFQSFKSGPAAAICRKAGFSIAKLGSWDQFTSAFQTLSERTDYELPKRFQTMPASSGETAVIQAILHAADYSRYADEMEQTWGRLDYVTGGHAEAVAASILRRG